MFSTVCTMTIKQIVANDRIRVGRRMYVVTEVINNPETTVLYAAPEKNQSSRIKIRIEDTNDTTIKTHLKK